MVDCFGELMLALLSSFNRFVLSATLAQQFLAASFSEPNFSR